MAKEKKKDTVTKRTLYHYYQALKKYRGLSIASIVSLPMNVFLVQFAIPYIFAQIIDKLTTETISSGEVWSVFLPYVIAVGVVALAWRIMVMIEVYSLWHMENRIAYDLASKAFTAVAKQSMRFHNNHFGGSLVSQTGKFVYAFERLWDTLIWSCLPIFFQIIFTVIILGPIVPWFVVGLLVFVVVYTFIAFLAFRKIAPLNTDLAEKQNRQSGQLADTVTNISSVKSYANEIFEDKRYSVATAKVLTSAKKLMWACFNRDSYFGIVFVGIFVLITIFLVGSNAWFGISIGTAVLIITYSQAIMFNLWDINNIFRNINRVFGDAYEMTKILDMPNDVVDIQGAKDLKVKKGEVIFDDISFTHADGKDAVFTNFDLVIEPGQRIGLVGRSGSGKTTLTKLLLRFADVNKGAITIDGQNISKVTQQSLRENIAYVPQETSLFHRSIAENIAYGRPNATKAEIKRAAELANAHEFIKDLPKGYDTLVGERGVKLSGGQRQRVAIARAILKDAPILVLDEATASLDTESEKLIQEALSRLMKNRTSIIVAHRLSTVAELDRIIVLDEGEIIEDDTHENLICEDGIYAKLWNRQTGTIE